MRSAIIVPCVVLLAACNVRGGDHPFPDSGPGTDGSVVGDGSSADSGALDAGAPDLGGHDAGGEACGTSRCGTGTYCCAAACNLCLPNAMFCLSDPCHGVDAGPPPVDAGRDAGDGGGTGATCGGFIGAICAAGDYCDYPISAGCGFADGTGTCMARPDACTDVYDPVCGCDGSTYGNACEAHAAGISVQSSGPCAIRPPPPPPPPPMSDCRTSGCTPSYTCMPCSGPSAPWVCVPPGVGCAIAFEG